MTGDSYVENPRGEYLAWCLENYAALLKFHLARTGKILGWGKIVFD